MEQYATIDDSNICQVVAIHRSAYLDDHFSSLMSGKYLERYYEHLLDGASGETSFLLISDTGPVGFVICGVGLNRRVQSFVRENWLHLARIVVTNPRFLVTKARSALTRFSKNKPWSSKAEMRVLSIAVTSARQGEGAGQKMLDHLEHRLRQAGIELYGLSVKNSNGRAIKFYKANNFQLERVDQRSSYFTKELSVSRHT